MDIKILQDTVLRAVLGELAKRGEAFVPVVSSNRHVHLSQRDVDVLFSPGYQLTKMRDLIQPGQFACNERVVIETPKGKMTLRVVGPVRKETQVELSVTEAFTLGLQPVIRMSGDTANTPGCTLTNGDRRVQISQGVIVAARHLHLSLSEAEAYGVKDGDVVSLVVQGPRGATLNNVVVRSGDAHLMEAHIDKEEANACGLADGQLCQVIKTGGSAQNVVPAPAAPPKEQAKALSDGKRGLITEADVKEAYKAGQKIIRLGKGAIITPLARDTAWEKGIELLQE